MDTDLKIKRVMVSISNAYGLESLIDFLAESGVEIFATSGTAKRINAMGHKCHKIEDLTGFAQMLDGRVKTLHPKVFAPILADMTQEKHRMDLECLGVKKFDMLVVNLYPFEDKAVEIAKGKDYGELNRLVEYIDIGGVALIRAAAKNFTHTAILTSPTQYEMVINEMRTHDGALSYGTRLKLAIEAFRHTAWYDAIIHSVFATYTGTDGLCDKIVLPIQHHAHVRYGENPNLWGAIYTPPTQIPAIAKAFEPWELGMLGMKIHQGKAMSFNNYMDTYAAWTMVNSFTMPCCTFVKHNNPCGLAIDSDIYQAFKKAYESDPLSAFGGIIAINRTFSKKMAEFLKGKFFEVIIAPSYEAEALEILAKKKNLRVLEAPQKGEWYENKSTSYLPLSLDIKKAGPYFLIQDCMTLPKDNIKNWSKVVSEREPTESEWINLDFAFRAVGFVKSNAIVAVKDLATIGIGAGQMSRVDAMSIALRKAGERAKGGVIGSDAFFPFRDSIDLAAEHGITAIAEPGGSIRDEEVITAANEHNIALVFTGIRVFRH